MRHKFNIWTNSSEQFLAEIELIPENDGDKHLIAGAKTATLNVTDHAYINQYLIQIILGNGYSPIEMISQKGNVFLFRVVT